MVGTGSHYFLGSTCALLFLLLTEVSKPRPGPGTNLPHSLPNKMPPSPRPGVHFSPMYPPHQVHPHTSHYPPNNPRPNVASKWIPPRPPPETMPLRRYPRNVEQMRSPPPSPLPMSQYPRMEPYTVLLSPPHPSVRLHRSDVYQPIHNPISPMPVYIRSPTQSIPHQYSCKVP